MCQYSVSSLFFSWLIQVVSVERCFMECSSIFLPKTYSQSIRSFDRMWLRYWNNKCWVPTKTDLRVSIPLFHRICAFVYILLHICGFFIVPCWMGIAGERGSSKGWKITMGFWDGCKHYDQKRPMNFTQIPESMMMMMMMMMLGLGS